MSVSKLDLKKRRIHAFFLSIETKIKRKDKIGKTSEELYADGMEYIQFRLPVDKISNEFEENLKKKIDKNIIKANIRKATKDDIINLRDLYNKSWLTSNTPYRQITKTSLLTIFEDLDTIFFISKVYGQDSGFVLLDFEGPNKEFAVIAALGIVPRYQRRGLGTIMGMFAWNYLKENFKNVKELRCEVYKDNAVSYAFIRELGFEDFGKKIYRREDFDPDFSTYVGTQN